MGGVVKKVTGSLFGSDIDTKGSDQARALQKQQTEQVAAQSKKEKLRLAEEGSVIAKKKAFIGSKASGRQSLIQTSQTGTKTTLGGT